ncbi:substrate-binding domain-containing protein [Streptomyces sp. M19]
MLAQGHRAVVYVSGPMHLAQCQDRRTGVLRAFAEAGRTRGAGAHRGGPAGRGVGPGRGGAAAGHVTRPTAVFCANDLLALGMLQALFAAGVSVPGEVALVGYDDIEFAAAAAVPLTSVRQPAFRMGRTAADLLIEETAESAEEHTHRRIVLQPELVVRDSSFAFGGRPPVRLTGGQDAGPRPPGPVRGRRPRRSRPARTPGRRRSRGRSPGRRTRPPAPPRRGPRRA